MRFNWRRRLVVTAFAAVSMLPFAGCSSQQQQATDEVAAEGQQQGGEEGDETAAQTQGGEESAQGGDETAAQDQAAGNPTANTEAGAENVAAVNEAAPVGDTGNGDLKEIISEMNGSGNAQPTNEAIPAEAVAEAAPVIPEAAPAPAETAAAPVAAPVQDAPAAVGGLPEMGSKMAYVVEPGDTLAKIATKVYGDQKRWRDIAGLSGLDNPNHIYPGDLVYYSLDEQSQNFAQTYETIKRGQETVREGDTLAAIAKRVYGSSKLWKHIWRQNDHIDNPDKLTAGMTVYFVEKDAIKAAFVKKFSNVKFAKKSTTSKKLTTATKNAKASAVFAASV